MNRAAADPGTRPARRTLRRVATAAGLAPLLVVAPMAGAALAKGNKTPAPVLTGKPANPTSHHSATFTYTDSSTASSLAFTCLLDGSGVPCNAHTTSGASGFSGSVTFTNLALGSHTFRVRAKAARHAPSAFTRYTWSVVPSPVLPPSLTQPSSPTNQTTVDVSWPANADVDHYTCSLNGAAATTCTSPFEATGLTDGNYQLTVTAFDDSGNNASSSVSWTVDHNAPAPAEFTGVPSDPSNNTAPVFTFDATDGSTNGFLCALDAAAFSSCTSGSPVAVAGDGSHTFNVESIDAAHNTSAATSYTWTLDTTAPVATSVAPTALLAPTKVHFSEAVIGANASTVHLRVAGTATNVKMRAVACYFGALPVGCTSAVDGMLLAPASPLMPGQSYRVAVAPTVTDRATNAVVSQTTAFRAPRTVQESSPAAVLAWRTVKAAKAFGQSFVTDRDAGARASYVFTGHRITWFTVAGPNQGRAAVYVDGVKKATVNNYAPEMKYRLARVVRGLGAGTHTLAILVLGRKGAPNAEGAFVSVDGFKVGSTIAAKPKLVTRWPVATATAASGGHYAWSALKGTSASVTFRGTSVRWWTVKGPSMGRARVYLDGELKGTFDQYASTLKFGVSHLWKGLTNSRHTIKVVPTGTHRAAAKGSRVAVDRFTVG